MRLAPRAWIVLGAACGLLCASVGCTQAPKAVRTTPSPAASASTTPSAPSAPVGTLNGGWTNAGELSTTRGGQMIGVLLQSGRVLVTGLGAEIGNVDIYDPAKGWSLGPKLSSDLPGAVAAPLPDGRALLAGGVPWMGGRDGPGPNPLATAMTYNPATGAWAKVPNMSVGRTEATATALPDGRVLVTGGYDQRVIQLTNPSRESAQILPLASSQLFSPKSSSWTTGPSLARSRFAHTAVALKGGRVLVVGGAVARYPDRILSTAELFDPVAGRWLSAGTIGAPRTQFTLTALADGRSLLTGGLAADGSTVLRSTLLYDPAGNKWSPGPDLAGARAGHAAALLADGRVLVTGGADQVGRLASAELLDSSAHSWSETGALATPRSDHLAISLQSGRILAIAGHGSADELATTELFDPSAKGTPAPARAPAGQGRWQLAAAKPTPSDAYGHSAQLLPDGRVLVVPAQAYPEFAVQAYDPKLDTWTTLFSRKLPACNNCGIGSPSPPAFMAEPLGSGRVLLLTVDPQRVIATKAEVIDLKTGKATPAASPGKAAISRLDLLPDGRVWLTALQLGDRHAFLYNPTTNRWTATSDVPAGLVGNNSDVQTVTSVPGSRVLVAGALRAMVYDPTSGRWAEAGSFPDTGGASIALGLPSWNGFSATGLPSGDVLLAGGTALQGTTPGGAPIYTATSQVMRWDHATGVLAVAESMPVGLYYHSSAALADGRVLLAGGSDSVGIHTSSDPITKAVIYDPATHAWTAAAPLPVARYQAIAATLADGRVVLIGGYGIFGIPASLLFSPQS